MNWILWEMLCMILSFVVVSLTMTHCVCTSDSIVGQVTWTFLGSGSVVLAQRRGVGQ